MSQPEPTISFIAWQMTIADNFLSSPMRFQTIDERGNLHSEIVVAPGYRLVVDEDGVRSESILALP